MERDKLLVDLSNRKGDTPRILVGLIVFGPIFGLRPCEWRTARIDGTEFEVKCAKRTNGRALADKRTVDITAMTDLYRQSLKNFLVLIQKQASSASSEEAFHERIAKALRRACERLKIRPISLYTLRHQCLATAKGHMSLAEVAALAGHRTTRTASRNYAKSRLGWKNDLPVRPSIECVLKVDVATGTQYDPAPEPPVPEVAPGSAPKFAPKW